MADAKHAARHDAEIAIRELDNGLPATAAGHAADGYELTPTQRARYIQEYDAALSKALKSREQR